MPAPHHTFAAFITKSALSLALIAMTVLVAMAGGRWIGTLWGMKRAKQSGFLEFGDHQRVTPRVDRNVDHAELWDSMPRFPAYRKSAWHRTEINDVTMYTGTMYVRGEPQDIVDYYIAQMAARGWHDVTEEFFNIDPYDPSCSASKILDQDPKALARYEKLRSHEAVLRRAGRSIIVHISPRAEKGQSVDLTLAETPDLKRFWTQTAKTYERAIDENATQKWMRVVDGCAECRGGAVANFMVSADSPETLSAEIIADMEREGWSRNPLFSPVEKKSTAGHLLTRGPHMAMVSTTHDPRIHRSTAMIIRMNE
ncbi:MAG: hypothetical protein O2901_09745 [Verrucomicrobia bacterium]|nr:hypothetical protein [Verrucomicrobiota bacterium]